MVDDSKQIQKVVHQIINDAISDVNKLPPKLSPFSLEWCFGQSNKDIPLNETVILSPVSHLGVLHDTKNGQKRFLCGMINKISCVSANDDHLALADSGAYDSSITLWNWKIPQLLRYWLNVFPTGAKLIDISPCGKFLTAISHTPQPIIIRWDIKGFEKNIAFLKPGDPVGLMQRGNETIITYPKTVLKMSWSQPDQVTQLEIPKNSNLGTFQKSAYLENHITAGTSNGKVVLWTADGKYQKTIFLHNSRICELKITNEKIRVGFQDGLTQFFDQTFRLLCETRHKSESFQTILSMELHPQKPILITGTLNGVITAYNIEQRTREMKQSVIDCGITCLKYSPSGDKLVLGSNQGDFILIDPILFNIETILQSTTVSVTHLLFPNEKEIIFINSCNNIGLFRMLPTGWVLTGQIQPHCSRIVGLINKENSLFTVGEDKMLVEITSRDLNVKETARIEETATPTNCVWHKNQIIVTNDDFRIRFIDPQTKQIQKTFRSPGSSPIHIMIDFNDEIIFAAGKEIGIWENGACIIGHAAHITAIAASTNYILTLGENDKHVIQWTKSQLKLPKPPITVPPIVEKKLSRIFKNATIGQDEIMKSLQLLGYYPSNFDIKNIQREKTPEKINKDELRAIFWNHGPPPEVSKKDLRDALLSLSEIKNSKPVVNMKKIQTILENFQKLSQEESQECLRILFGPNHVPATIPLDTFLAILE